MNKNWFTYIIPALGFLTPFVFSDKNAVVVVMQGFFLAILIFIIPFMKNK